jgi:hypothetical protein
MQCFPCFWKKCNRKQKMCGGFLLRWSRRTKGFPGFKASKHHMWIQATRDPKKKWLEMRYCASREEVDWIVKDWSTQWKVPVTNKGSKPKEQAEAGTSKKTSISSRKH